MHIDTWITFYKDKSLAKIDILGINDSEAFQNGVYGGTLEEKFKVFYKTVFRPSSRDTLRPTGLCGLGPRYGGPNRINIDNLMIQRSNLFDSGNIPVVEAIKAIEEFLAPYANNLTQHEIQVAFPESFKQQQDLYDMWVKKRDSIEECILWPSISRYRDIF